MGYENGVISLIGMNGEKLFDCPIHDTPVLLICANAKRLASVNCDDRIRLWSIEGGCECVDLDVRFMYEFTKAPTFISSQLSPFYSTCFQ